MFIRNLKHDRPNDSKRFSHEKFLLQLVLIFALLSGCSGGGSSSGGDSTQDDTTGPDTTSEVTISEEPGPAVNLAPSALGSATFTRDEARRQSAIYPADGQSLTLQATDAGGLTWTLEIPGNALLESRTIIMTPLTAITSGTDTLAGGILLEPDGLQFLSAATLSVTGTGPENHLILTGKHDGSGLEIAGFTASEAGATAQILHFSSYFEPDEDQIQRMLDNAITDFASAKAAALELIGKPISVPPPPSVEYNCMGTAAYQDPGPMLDEYVKQVNSPEAAVIERLLTLGQAQALLGGSSDEAIELALKVQDRVIKKVNSLIQTYQPQPEKFAAVSRAALAAWSEYSLLGGDAPAAETLQPWAQKVRDYYLDELRAKHDYSVMPALVPLARLADLLGDADPAFLDSIVKAMTFRVSFDTVATANGSNGPMVFGLHGDIDAKHALDNGWWQGTGSGDYISFESGEEELHLVMPNTFPVTVSMVNLDACVNQSVDLFIDRFGAGGDTFYSIYGTWGNPGGYVHPLGSGLFVDEYVMEMNKYNFTLSLTNFQAEAANELYFRQYAGAAMEYRLKVVHTPE